MKFIFCPLVLISVFYTPIRGQTKVCDVQTAEIGKTFYDTQVSLWVMPDMRTYFISAITNSQPNVVPVHGPFTLRDGGPYAMLAIKIWLNTNDINLPVILTFATYDAAKQFYQYLSPLHPTPCTYHIILNRVIVHKPLAKNQSFIMSENAAMDIIAIQKPEGGDSGAYKFIVHNLDNNQSPILIFHSLEFKINLRDINTIDFKISPENTGNYHFSLVFQNTADILYFCRLYDQLPKLPDILNSINGPNDRYLAGPSTTPLSGPSNDTNE